MFYYVKKNPAMFFYTLLLVVAISVAIFLKVSTSNVEAVDSTVEENLREEIEILKEANEQLQDTNWHLSEALQKQDAELQELKGE